MTNNFSHSQTHWISLELYEVVFKPKIFDLVSFASYLSDQIVLSDSNKIQNNLLRIFFVFKQNIYKSMTICRSLATFVDGF